MKRTLKNLALIAALASFSFAASPDTRMTQQKLMARVESNVQNFLSVFSDMKCTETVEQYKIGKNGKPEYTEKSRFDYLLIADSGEGELNLTESRVEEHTAQHKKNVSLLVSNGFATSLLIFHPYYQSGFSFTVDGNDLIDGASVVKVRFHHIRGLRTPAALMLRGREYPLELQGTAWIDPASGIVRRIQTDLQASMEDLGLRTLHTDVTYAPVNFRGMDTATWMPSEAMIEVETPKQHWRNRHQFTNYRHFSVDTEHQDAAPKESQ